MAEENTGTYLVKKPIPDEFTSSLEKIVDDTFYRKRGTESITRGKDNGTVTVKKDGTVSLTADKLSNLRIDPGMAGRTENTSATNTTTTNSYTINAKDIIINNHKLNNKLYELSNFKNVLNGYDNTPRIVGGLTMLGTVLVKAWDANLKRYVLIRRQINIPMFSPSIGAPEVHPGINVTPDMKLIQNMMDQLDMTGISTYAQLSTVLEAKRKEAILAQEAATTEKNKTTIEANKQKQAVSMTTLTGQDPTQFGAMTVAGATQNFNVSPQAVSDTAKIKGDAEKEREHTDKREGWDEANGRPVSTTAYWYHVQCKAHKFNVMQGHTVIKTYPCNTSNKGTTSNKISGDNKTLLGIFQINSVEKNNMEADKRSSGCKLPNTAGTFGTYWMALSCGFGIGIHGDYPSEDAKKILTKDAPADREPQPGEGSTHGCIRLYNSDVAEVATKYAKMTPGQYIKIEA